LTIGALKVIDLIEPYQKGGKITILVRVLEKQY
jgi:F0F1-type ATP synthase beta subunit